MMKNSFAGHLEALSAEVPLFGFRSHAGFLKAEQSLVLHGFDVEIASLRSQ